MTGNPEELSSVWTHTSLNQMRVQQEQEHVLILEDRRGSGPDPLDLDSGSVVLELPSGVVLESYPTDDEPVEDGWLLYPGETDGGVAS